MLLGENGIINKARQGKEDYARAEKEERGELSEIEEYINVELADNYTKVGEIVEGIQQHSITIPEGFNIATLDEDTGVVTGVMAKNGWNAYLTQESINAGIVVVDGEGNEFVWVPVDDINSMVMCKNHTNEILSSNLQCQTCLNNTELVGKLYWDESSWEWSDTAITGYSANSGLREPAVVTSYDSSSTLVYEGLFNDTTLTDEEKTTEKFLQQLQQEFKKMVESVNKYKGFYIGRYETSLPEGRVKSVRGKDAMIRIDWYNMYIYQKGIETETVKSSMIYGSQWDQTLKWLVSSEANVADSRSWGYHSDRITLENIEEVGLPQKTGFSENWKAKNIYDLAGNVWEWTTEANSTDSRVTRGGDYNLSGSDYPVSYHNNCNPTYDEGSSLRFSSHTLHKITKHIYVNVLQEVKYSDKF